MSKGVKNKENYKYDISMYVIQYWLLFLANIYLIYIMKYIISILVYYFIFYLFSVYLTKILEFHTIPIPTDDAYRILNIVPIREIIGITPISFIIWFIINKILQRSGQIHILFIESFILMFVVGFIIHKIFNIKSKLGNLLGFLELPDGTGFAPYTNY